MADHLKAWPGPSFQGGVNINGIDPPPEPEPLAPGLNVNFSSITFDSDSSTSGFYHIPPDPIGAAGLAHVVAVVNTSIRWQTKASTSVTTLRLGKNSSTFSGSFFATLSPTNGTFDPKVIFDQHANRFVVVALERTDTANGNPANTSRILLAASDDADPNGTWYYKAIDAKINIGGLDTWADYPSIAVDEEALYVTGNMFTFGASGSYRGSRLWIINKSQFYSNVPAAVTVHDPFASVGLGNGGTLQPAHVYGAVGIAPNTGTFLLNSGWTSGADDLIAIIRVDNPLSSPSFSNQMLNVGNVDAGFIPSAPQLGSANTIDTGSSRIQRAVWRDNKLYATHTVSPPAGPDAGQATAHYYVIETTNLASLALSEQGDVGGEDIAPGTYTFYPNIAVDSRGNIGIGFAASGPGIYPGAYYTVRATNDPPGMVQPTGTLRAGVDYYYRAFGGSRNRWGDYSGIAIDPNDERTFWVFNEYAMARGTILSSNPTEDGRWATHWGSLNVESNVAPVLAVAAGPLDYLENAPAIILDGAATVSDVDNLTFNAGALTVNITSNGMAEDRLIIRNEGSGPGQIGLSSGNVRYGGTNIGTFSGGGSGFSPLVVTLNINSFLPAVQALLRNITYTNVSDNPSTLARTIRFIQTDGLGGSSAPVTTTVNITPVNDAPTLTTLTNLVINENAGIQIVTLTGISAGDGETQTLSLTAMSDNPSLIADPAVSYTSPEPTGSLSFSPLANQTGTASITVILQDDGGTANGGVDVVTNVFTVTVNAANDPPELPVLLDQQIAELTTLFVTNTATDNNLPAQILTYELINPPPGATIDAQGVITYSPDEAAGPGTNIIRTVVTDDGVPPASATNFFNVIVDEVNTAPNLPAQDTRTIAEFILLTVTNTATDTDLPANNLTYTLLDAPAGANIDGHGVITWTPGETSGSTTNSFVVVVNDNGAPPFSDTNSFLVFVEEANATPELPAFTNFTIPELTTLIVTNTATDSDEPGNSLAYALLDAPAGAMVDTNGLISWTPDESQGPGTNLFVMVVTDDGTPPASATNSFTVFVTEVNSKPELPELFTVVMDELTKLTVSNVAMDVDLPPNVLSYQLIDPPSGAIIDADGVITWTPDESQGPGTNVIMTVVTDDGTPPLSSTNTFTVIVMEVNTPPKLPVQKTRTIAELSTLIVTNTATDMDLPPNVLSYELRDAPTGAAIDGNGVISWTPDESQGPGTNELTTVVSDGIASVTNGFTVVVTEAVDLTPPDIQSIAVSNKVVTVTWLSVTGQTYRLQFKDEVDGADWSNQPPDVLALTPTSTMTNLGSGLQRFYRVMLVP